MSSLSPCWYWEGEIPSKICDYIVNSIDKNNYRKGLLLNNAEPGEIRKVNVQFTDLNWINALLNGYIRFANNTNFHFDLSEEDKEFTQVSRYSEGEYYSIHPDFSYERECKSHTRKLSLSLQLSSESDYSGGDLILYHHKEKYICPKTKGTIFVFDSRLIHEVTEITQGVRYSLVKWYHGDKPLR
tara:strand:+ start:249 stop:803 length:555 start_codon:yes stop_codon:yes gene_type:complete